LIVVDSSVWIANLRGQQTAQVRLLQRLSEYHLLIVGDLVIAEVLQGARDQEHAARIEWNLRRHVVVPMVNDKLAVSAARNYRVMRAAGITIRKTIDVLIATFCIERGHDLLHNDRDFDGMETLLGLSIVR
jgi:predicted nucleic acid-binding protein